MAVLSVTAELSSLPKLREYILEQARLADLPEGTDQKIDLVLEELLVNIANHAYRHQGGPLEVDCFQRGKSFCCLLRDWGPPFNPMEAGKPDVGQDIMDRPIGGLGIFLATTMPDHCSYERLGNANELTFCFHLKN
ncbi:ATP-binding protein [Pseudodesulfovibrio sp.]|uniref:ATP-binding protein n=1 Tax=unclassified Pseudodesulfovibrio TaxID=2661612 RepID=UPI003B0025DA